MISFIIFFLNDILRSFAIKERFLKLGYKFINDIKKQNFVELKNKNIGDIISNKISSKYKKDKNINSNLYELLKSNKVLEKIFDIKYITFFEKYYMKKEKIIDLRIFGIEKEIPLSNETKTYYEFLEKEKSKAKDEKYINQIKECLNKYYLKKKSLYYIDAFPLYLYSYLI